MRNCNSLTVLLLLLLAFTSSVLAQTSKKYQSRTLAQVVELNRTSTDKIFGKTKLEERSQFIGIDPMFTKAHVQFLGDRRQITEGHRVLIDWWRKLQKIDGKFIQLYQEEFLFKEGSEEYWIPCQTQTAELIAKNFKNGDKITLLVAYIGAHKEKNEKDYSSLFLSTGFEP